MADKRDHRGLEAEPERDLPRRGGAAPAACRCSERVCSGSAEALQNLVSKIKVLAVLAPTAPPGPPRFTFQIDGEKEVCYGRVLSSRHGECRDDGEER